jgi:hypothetical protein
MLDVHSDEASGDEIMPDVDQEELPVSDVGADGVAGLTAQHSLEKVSLSPWFPSQRISSGQD